MTCISMWSTQAGLSFDSRTIHDTHSCVIVLALGIDPSGGLGSGHDATDRPGLYGSLVLPSFKLADANPSQTDNLQTVEL